MIQLTFLWSMETDVKLLHAIVDQCDLVIGHETNEPFDRESSGRRQGSQKESAIVPSELHEDSTLSCNTYSFITSVSMRLFGDVILIWNGH